MPYVTRFLRVDGTLIKSTSSVSIRHARKTAMSFLQLHASGSASAEIRDSTSGILIDALGGAQPTTTLLPAREGGSKPSTIRSQTGERPMA